jgi:seryl-tRNA synthetase
MGLLARSLAGGSSQLTGSDRSVKSNLRAVIDLKMLRENPDAVRRSQLSRGEDPALVDTLLTADADRRAAISAADSLRAEQKTASKSVGSASAEERPALLQRAKELAEQVKAVETVQAQTETAFTAAHMAISNVILDGVPAGGEDDYAVLDIVGDPPQLNNPKDHLELGESLGLIDMQRGAKVSGSRFYFLTGRGALLQLGLLQLALRLAVENGFIPVIPPVLVRPEVMAGTGFLGAHADEVYRVEADDLYLVGTSEVPLAGYHSDEILDLSGGPLRYAGWSSCFRREAGSYGKDTRGIIRVHQFDKVEGFVYCKPDDAEAEHQRLLGWQREMLARIEVPYRVIDVAAGDLGSSAARKFDCEAWVPTQQTYRELTSTSNCTTFQARRLATRYRDDNGKPQIAATLNGTLGTTRWLVSILENHQRPDGSVRVPEALVPYVGTGTRDGEHPGCVRRRAGRCR